MAKYGCGGGVVSWRGGVAQWAQGGGAKAGGTGGDDLPNEVFLFLYSKAGDQRGGGSVCVQTTNWKVSEHGTEP